MDNFDLILQNIREKIADRKDRIGQPNPQPMEAEPFLLSSEMVWGEKKLSESQKQSLANTIVQDIIKRTGENQHALTLYNIVYKSICSWNNKS